MIFSVPFILILSVMPERIPPGLTFKINGIETISKIDGLAILYIIALVVGFGFFTYALHLFRKTLDFFSKKIIFDTRVITSLNQCGKAILTGYFICIGAEFLYKMITHQMIEFKLNFSLDGTIAIISLGLFFIVLAEVFQMAKKIKEENDLTV